MKARQANRSQTLTVLAPAKLNLSLHIVGKRADQYHELITLFQSIDLYDRLHFHFSPAGRDNLEILLDHGTADDGFPLDDTNIIKKAAAVYMAASSKYQPLDITVSVKKNIPIGAGLAGGSANAAATLLALNCYQENKFSDSQLMALASEVGSDVPFSLSGGTCLGRGRGEKLLKLPAQTDLFFILVKPKALAVSTAWAYDTFDQTKPQTELDATNLEEQLVTQFTNEYAHNNVQLFDNSFEAVVFEHHPVLRKIKDRLISLGCLCAHMTGSGPTIYGLVRDFSEANRILASFKQAPNTSAEPWYKHQQFEADVWLVRSINHGVKVIEDEESR